MTTMGGGKDREWLEPLDAGGRRQTEDPSLDNMVGTHAGSYVGLNLLGAQEGMEYVWERNNPADVLRARQQGGQVVGPDDPERSVMREATNVDYTPLDGSEIYKDVVLVRYPAEAVRRRREHIQQKAESMQRGGARDFADRATSMERELAQGLPTRFRRADHRVDFTDSEGQLVDQWTPESGIIDKG